MKKITFGELVPVNRDSVPRLRPGMTGFKESMLERDKIPVTNYFFDRL
jgi:hypothetical protein